jgi:hypothetical protein
VLQFPKSDESIQRIMQSHGVRKTAGEISAHFPIDTDDVARCSPLDEAVASGRSEFEHLCNVRWIASHKGRPAEAVHPFGQIMKILTIAIPFQSLVDWFTNLAFLERLADPQTASGRMTLSGFFIQAADPALTNIVTAITPEHLIHLVDQVSCATAIEFIASPFEQLKKIANRKGVGPKVSLLIF